MSLIKGETGDWEVVLAFMMIGVFIAALVV